MYPKLIRPLNFFHMQLPVQKSSVYTYGIRILAYIRLYFFFHSYFAYTFLAFFYLTYFLPSPYSQFSFFTGNNIPLSLVLLLESSLHSLSSYFFQYPIFFRLVFSDPVLQLSPVFPLKWNFPPFLHFLLYLYSYRSMAIIFLTFLLGV